MSDPLDNSLVPAEQPDGGAAPAPGSAPTEASRDDSPAAEVVDETEIAAGAPDLQGAELEDEDVGSVDDGRPAAAPIAGSTPPPEEPVERQWYILKVQSNREESIKQGLLRRVKIAGLDDYFGEVVVPVEMVTEFKNGKKRVVKRKLYPGYIIVNMDINDDTWFLVRETPGIGDFTGAGGKPMPMDPREIERFVKKPEDQAKQQPRIDIKFKAGERVKINDGTFENFEGEVESIDESNGRVTVMINIFGRSTPVELEYWQVESM